jgi:hypothetical protein
MTQRERRKGEKRCDNIQDIRGCGVHVSRRFVGEVRSLLCLSLSLSLSLLFSLVEKKKEIAS